MKKKKKTKARKGRVKKSIKKPAGKGRGKIVQVDILLDGKKDGKLKDGMLKDGILRDGKLKDGIYRDGKLQDGELKDGEFKLTSREIQILQHMADGFSSKDIAEKLNISFDTVESHRKSINKKLNVKSAAEATAHGIRHHLIK